MAIQTMASEDQEWTDRRQQAEVMRRFHHTLVPALTQHATVALLTPDRTLQTVDGCADIDLEVQEIAWGIDTAISERRATSVVATRLGPIAVAPLCVRDEVLGVFAVTITDEADFALQQLEVLAARAAIVCDNARLSESLQASEDRFRLALENAPIGMAIVQGSDDGPPRYTDANSAFCALLGVDRLTVLGSEAGCYAHPDDRGVMASLRGWLADEPCGTQHVALRIVRPDGEMRHVRINAAVLGGRAVLLQIEDHTAAIESEAALEHLAHHDALTGLLNRPGYEQLLRRALDASCRYGDSGAVLVLDIDDFKHINETYGTHVGDEVLRQVGRVLAERMRRTDAVARLGDDEFAVLMERTGIESARAVARIVVEDIRALTLPIEERTVRISASAGLRLFDGDAPGTLCEVLGGAELAVCETRVTDRGGVTESAAHDQPVRRRRAAGRWSEEIRDALATDRFVLYEQPIMCLDTDRIDRVELLLRMIGRDGTVVGPSEFLPIAERDGQIRAIDRWVIRNAIRILSRREGLSVSCNVSARGLCDPALVDYMVSRISQARIDPGDLTVEITETAGIPDVVLAREQLGRLSELGCRLAIDDFGDGFSSFTYLKHLPVDLVKIDGQFVRHLCFNRADQATVRAIVEVAAVHGVEVVAEHVEDEGTLAKLREIGVDYVQGYFIGEPAPVELGD